MRGVIPTRDTIRNLWRAQTDIQLKAKKKVEGNDANTEEFGRPPTLGAEAGTNRNGLKTG